MRATRSLYRGLPIAGPSYWTDSWGAPRLEFGNSYRRHQGQDLFCRAGAPLLALDQGWVEHDTDLLGGKVVRLHLASGDYWYYAHLSEWQEKLVSGSEVQAGDVIGFCGTSGNAKGTPPHLHLGLYSRGVAVNPIGFLDAALERSATRAHAMAGRLGSPRRDRKTSTQSTTLGTDTCPETQPELTVADILLRAFLPASLLTS